MSALRPPSRLLLALAVAACGDPESPPQRTSKPVPLRAQQISAGGDHSCALDFSGQVLCWGSNLFGELGTPGEPAFGAPVAAASGATRYERVVAADYVTCAFATGTGALQCWGQRTVDELGAPWVDSPVPVTVEGGFQFHEVALGSSHACALQLNYPYCWGRNRVRQLGDSTTVASLTPIGVEPRRAYLDLVAGHAHTCGHLANSGATYCWGNNVDGELGTGSPRDAEAEPAPVSGGRYFPTLALGGSHSCALTVDGEAYCWGSGVHGQLGTGEFQVVGEAPVTHRTPVPVAGGARFRALAAGDAHTCGIARDGRALCWGANDHHQTGTASADAAVLVPTPVLGDHRFLALSAGTAHTCGLAEDAAVYCWGDNWAGQAGAPEPAPVAAPRLVTRR